MQVMIWLNMLNIMPLKEVFLLTLLNTMRSCVIERTVDGWFQCSVQFLQENTGGQFDRNIQNRLLNRLKERGYVEVKRVGMPARRHIKVNMGKAINDARRAMPKSQPSQLDFEQLID